MTIRHLPPVTIEGHQSSGAGTPDHPMRVATLRAAGINSDGWTDDLRHDVEHYFDDLAGEWHTRISPERTAVFADALTRGLNELPTEGGLALEVGSGIGTCSALLAERSTTVLAIDSIATSWASRSSARPRRETTSIGHCSGAMAWSSCSTRPTRPTSGLRLLIPFALRRMPGGSNLTRK